MGFFQASRRVFAALGLVYGALVVLLAIPYFQSHALFLHALKFPLFAQFDKPELYGLAPNKTANIYIPTNENQTIGAWFVLAEPFYQSLPDIPSSHPVELIPAALATNAVILFLHGNAATRAYRARVHHYAAFSARLGVNVLAIDYRGYADSTGTPTQSGVVRDARAAFDWLLAQGTTADQILIVGHSLGTGIGALLSAELSDEGISPRGLVLLSPFSSIEKVLETYRIAGLFPLIKPLSMIPGATTIVQKALIHRFDTDRIVPRMKGPILIAHAQDDWDIPYTHSVALFDTFLEPFLPESPSLPPNAAMISHDEWSAFNTQLALRKSVRADVVTTVEMPHFGTLQEFDDVAHGRKVVYLQTLAGGHDYLGVQEGVQDVIGKMFGLKR
ncbi:AB hydrolase-1 domain-containing protein [Mycena chlorophos]|uniref:AB hydrolase-1 domain-containing protein n=1 Tax=Mycena chlorophos TaxID=658473 RepID=A0A8H6SCM1_MYCCL|nr:AB hydrolase-1 domain-containing protein [Mycena chlorophos]